MQITMPTLNLCLVNLFSPAISLVYTQVFDTTVHSIYSATLELYAF